MSAERQIQKVASSSSSGSSRSGTGKNSSESKAIQDLPKENALLVQELTEIRLLHEQLLHEGSSENFSQNRVNILKSQVFQLERQVVVLSNVVSNHAGVHAELFSLLETIVSQLSAGNQTSDKVLERARLVQSRLSKLNRGYPDSPLLFTNGFTEASSHLKGADSPKKPATVLDVCLDKTNHINIKRVGQLETKLANLFSELVKLQSSLQTLPTSPPFLLQPMREHCCDHATSCCVTISDCCYDLLSLSLLVPNIPWARKATPLHPEINATGIMKSMPTAIKTRKEVREAVERASNYFVYLHDMNKAKEELQFHKSAYALQVSYVGSLIDAVRSGYEKFETSVQDLICKPLTNILSGYNAWNSAPCDKALGEFLHQVQVNREQLMHAPQLVCAVESFREHPRQTAMLSEFGENFLKALAELENGCSMERSKAMKARDC